MASPGSCSTIKVTGKGPDLTLAPTVQQSVNASWRGGNLPFSIPAGRDASYTYSGVLISPEDGEWEVLTRGRATVTIADKPLELVERLHTSSCKRTSYSDRDQIRLSCPLDPTGIIQIRAAARDDPDMTPAKTADAVIVCAGFNGDAEHEGADRDFEFSGAQQRIIASAAAANPKTIVVVNSGAGFATQGWLENASAVLQAYYLGQEGGTALGEILFGDVNPSGHLCSTFDRDI